jgi:hypothetical protein
MKRKKTKKLELNKTSIANLGDRILDLDKVRGGDETVIKCPITDSNPPPTDDPLVCS